MAINYVNDEAHPFQVEEVASLFSVDQIIEVVNELISNGYKKASFSLKNGIFVTDSRELAVYLDNN